MPTTSRIPRSIVVAFALPVALLGAGTAARAEPFSFVALGDTTYAVPEDYPLYEALIAEINAAQPAFSVHVGDTKGFGDCGRAFQESQRVYFDKFAAPVVYAPGNNEWADCWRANRGSAEPLEILGIMRDVFWSKPVSLGARTMPLERQADTAPEFAEYSENARWRHGGATFATLNITGTWNQLELREERWWKEFVRREKANVAWVQAAFAAARAGGDRGVVFAFHTNPFLEEVRWEGGPSEAVLQAIIAGADAFDGQVLVVHGHTHEFTIDRPVTELDTHKPSVSHPNLTRLQVYGWPDMKAVRVTVDVSKRWVFGFEPLYAASSVSTTSARR